MENIPIWIKACLPAKELVCYKCKKVFEEKNIVSLGVKQSYQRHKEDVAFVEMTCSQCENTTQYALKKMPLLTFAEEILHDSELDAEEYAEELRQARERAEIRKKSGVDKRITPIKKQEIDECRKFLKQASSHEDFLRALGFTDQQIETYRWHRDNRPEAEEP